MQHKSINKWINHDFFDRLFSVMDMFTCLQRFTLERVSCHFSLYFCSFSHLKACTQSLDSPQPQSAVFSLNTEYLKLALLAVTLFLNESVVSSLCVCFGPDLVLVIQCLLPQAGPGWRLLVGSCGVCFVVCFVWHQHFGIAVWWALVSLIPMTHWGGHPTEWAETCGQISAD